MRGQHLKVDVRASTASDHESRVTTGEDVLILGADQPSCRAVLECYVYGATIAARLARGDERSRSKASLCWKVGNRNVKVRG